MPRTHLAIVLLVTLGSLGDAWADNEASTDLYRNVELSLELHGGVALTLGDDVEIHEESRRGSSYDPLSPPRPPRPDYFSQRVSTAQHATLGGRVTGWGCYPTDDWGARAGFGISLEGSYWSAASEIVERHNVYRSGALLLVRVEFLRSEGLPHGILRPYVGGGVGGAVSSLSLDLPPEAGGPVSDTVLGISASARAGLSVGITPFLSLYLEAGFEFVTARITPNLRSPDPDYKLRIDRFTYTHTLVVGVTLSL